MDEHLLAKIGQYALIKNEEGKLLVVERPKSRTWCLPGGRLEVSERDWEAALLREVREETGLECKNPHPVGVEIEEDPYQIKYCIYFEVECEDLSRFELDPEEHSAFRWVDLGEAKELNIESEKLNEIVLNCLS